MGKQPKTLNKSCVICGWNRIVDRAHILPKRIFAVTKGFKRFGTYTEKNILFLCKNHHFLFDSFALNDEEWQKIYLRILEFWPQIKEASTMVLVPKNEIAHFTAGRKNKSLKKWVKNITAILIKYAPKKEK